MNRHDKSTFADPIYRLCTKPTESPTEIIPEHPSRETESIYIGSLDQDIIVDFFQKTPHINKA